MIDHAHYHCASFLLLLLMLMLCQKMKTLGFLAYYEIHKVVDFKKVRKRVWFQSWNFEKLNLLKISSNWYDKLDRVYQFYLVSSRIIVCGIQNIIASDLLGP